jgi:MFS family permease
MPDTPPAAAAPLDPYSSLRIGNFRDYLVGNTLALVGRQAVIAVAIWQVYAWTHSSAMLGFVGLINVLPLLLFILPAGSLADRYDRKRVIAIGTAALAVLNLGLAALAHWHAAVPDLAPLRWGNALLRHVALPFERHTDPASLRFDEPALPLVLLLLFAHATVRVLIWPARGSIMPLLVPVTALGNAITWNASAFELATITGPAIGGMLIDRAGFALIYAAGAGFEVVFLVLLRPVKYFVTPVRFTAERSWREVLAGVEFIWRQKVMLGASSLDLFATLLGGATALLPVYADQILHVGPAGFGWLRAAPSLGAITMAVWVAHRPPLKRPGHTLLWAVAGFGAAVVAFGISRWFWLSLAALFVTGALDNISVVVRQSLVQLLTPDALRGRVTAVNQIFIGSSNEIGALRAGLMAALIGPVAAVVWGGLGTVAVTGAIARAVPTLRRLAPLHTLKTGG